MARKITGVLYKLTYDGGGYRTFVECSSEADLYEHVAREILEGRCITAVNEMRKETGSHPKVAIFTDPKFQKVLRELKLDRKEGA